MLKLISTRFDDMICLGCSTLLVLAAGLEGSFSGSNRVVSSLEIFAALSGIILIGSLAFGTTIPRYLGLGLRLFLIVGILLWISTLFGLF
jgi:hypothetical protein